MSCCAPEPRRRKRKGNEELKEISPEELGMAKYVRFYTPKKTAKIQGEQIEYFVGSKAVDTLLNSKYGLKCKKPNPRVNTREKCLNFLQAMLDNEMFKRGERVLKEDKKGEDSKKKTSSGSGDDSSGKKKSEKEESTAADIKKNDEKKKKRRYTIGIHECQQMLDSNDIYVWVFDPVPPKKKFLGFLAIIAIVIGTMFPLWPPSMRQGVSYIAMAGGAFMGLIILIALLRSIFFGIVWMVSMGKYHIWFLPNLLADVGFFESFKPVYTIDIKSSTEPEEKKKSEMEKIEEEKDEDVNEDDGENKHRDSGSDFEIIEPSCKKTD